MSVQVTDERLRFYRTQSAVTDPRDFAGLYDALPETVEGISRWLHNVLVHNWKVEVGGVRLTGPRRGEIEIRPIAALLARIVAIDARPWSVERPIDSRVVVDCRHFATLLCSILRHRNIPARTRHGFASYLQPGHSQSHVICEYWDAGRDGWLAADPDTLSEAVSGNQFITADAAWRGIRSDGLAGEQFGYAPNLRGAWCVRWEFVRDVAALNRQEMLTFDVWGLNARYAYDESLTPNDAALLDQIATLLRDECREFPALRALYETDERVRVPPVIRSQPYTTGQTHIVDLAQEGSLNA